MLVGGSLLVSAMNAVQKTPLGAVIVAEPGISVRLIPVWMVPGNGTKGFVPKFVDPPTGIVATPLPAAVPLESNRFTVTLAAAALPFVHENTVPTPLLMTPGTDQTLSPAEASAAPRTDAQKARTTKPRPILSMGGKSSFGGGESLAPPRGVKRKVQHRSCRLEW
jgi:hypothetical protein